ncbi:MAG: hypothetical protein JW730_18210 [Anaerolineales bacterium]|nr:hypothetical protein [Anaerolineales bacterium]
MRRALDYRALLHIGLPISLDDLDADEMIAMLILEEEQNRFDNEKINNGQ